MQIANGKNSRFNGWLRHFNGISTRYLANYLGWRRAIAMRRIGTAKAFFRVGPGAFPT